MRKLALLTVILLTVCLTGAFAELTGVGAPTASGSVTVIVGFDLDNSSFGFVNDSSITISMPLLDGSAGASGSDDMYGMITIDAIGWSLDDDEGLYDADEDSDAYGDLDASISASLHIDPLVITLGEPDFAINNVDVSDDYSVDANADDAAATGGISIGYVSDLISVTAKIATENDYRDSTDDVSDANIDDDLAAPFFNDITDDDDAETYTPNEDMNMVFGADIALAPADGITVDVSFMFDADFAGTDALMGVGADIGVAMAPLTVAIPVDFVSVGDKSAFELWPSITVDLMENFSIAADFLYGSYTDLAAGDNNANIAGVPVNAVAEAGVTVTDSGAFVDALTWSLAFALADMMDYLDAGGDTAWDLDVDAAYDIGGLAPYVNFGLDEASNFDFGVGATMSADFTGIDNTTVTVDFTNEGGDPAESGRLTVDITVAF